MQPKTKRTCEICGDAFFVAGKARGRFCKKEQCKIEGIRKVGREYSRKVFVPKGMPTCALCDNVVSHPTSKLCIKCKDDGKTIKEKKCSSCKQVLPADKYRKTKQGRLTSRCLECTHKRSKELYDPDKTRTLRNVRAIENPLIFRARRIANTSKNQDKALGFDTSKTVTWNQVYAMFLGYPDMLCYICHKKMTLDGLKEKTLVTLDRQNNDLGHEPDNVKMCCWGCNNKRGAVSWDMAMQIVLSNSWDPRVMVIRRLVEEMNQNPAYPKTKMIEDVVEW